MPLINDVLATGSTDSSGKGKSPVVDALLALVGALMPALDERSLPVEATVAWEASAVATLAQSGRLSSNTIAELG